MSTSTSNNNTKIITAILPSASTVNIEWIKSLPSEGARDVVILSHPYDDGIYREDAYSLLSRLHSRPALLTKDFHWLETTPGDSKTVGTFLENLQRKETQDSKQPPTLPTVKDRDKLTPSLVSGLIGTILLLGLFAIALPLDIPSSMSAANQSALRIAIDAHGKIEASNIPEGITLPEGTDPVAIFGGEHFPMSVQVIVDGKTILDEIFKPSGVSGNGRISALKFLEIESGTHQVEIIIKDDSDEYRSVFSGEVNFEPGRVLILSYDEKTDTFLLR